jgi:hypothetical protein
MPTLTDDQKTAGTVQALVQLLRSRSYDEIRQRMYDNPPGSAWWVACKSELEIRNSDRVATSLTETSRVLQKMKNSAEHLESLTDTLLQATDAMADLLRGVKESGRRMEIVTYVIVGVTIVQMFFLAFTIFGKK